MKKFVIAVAATSAMLGVSAAQAENGHVYFKGQVQDTTCEIDAGSLNQTVELPTVMASALAEKGATAGMRSFSINMTKCPTDRKIGIRFEQTGVVDEQTGWLKNTIADGGAKNVAIELLDRDSQPVAINTNLEVPYKDAVVNSDGNVNENYKAHYVATGKAEPGQVAANVGYTITYR